MNPERWRQIDDLFQQLIEQPADQRSAVLRRSCPDDSELMRDVRSLLEAHEHEETFLESPVHGGASKLLELEPPADINDLVGKRLGAWRITRVLAVGGMGTVYLAVRDDHTYEQTAAIKLSRGSLLGSSPTRRAEIEHRFRTERQVLASLEHPYIARLLDGGASEDGRQYFVMEFVEGATIDSFCEQRRLNLRDRAALFVKVCQAVQHAHQSLIIHRDLKPSNILVSSDGVPKLLDFGLAKLLDAHSNAATGTATVTGEFMGTFAFAAPEQLSDLGAAPDTRTDVYSLGMILYLLVTGRHAYDVSGVMTDVLRRITIEPPEAPSRIAPQVDDELSTIVLKALAKEPARRYQSAGDLRADLERYLRGEPILAKGDSGWYVLRKHVRRYRVTLAVLAAFVLVIASFAVVATIQAARLARQKTTLAESLRISNIERGRAMGMVGNIPLAEQLLWHEHLDSSRPHEPARGDHADDRLAYWALWELYLNEPCLRTMKVPLATVSSLARSSDDQWLALIGRGAPLVVLNAQTGETQFTVPVDASLTFSLCFRPGTTTLAVAGLDGSVSLWDVVTRQRIASFEHGECVYSVAFSRDGRRLLATLAHAAVLWDVDRGEQLLKAPFADAMLTALALSPDGTRFAAGAADGRVWLLDAADGRVLHSFFENGRVCGSVCFSPDGQLLAVVTGGTKAAVIDVASGQPIARLMDSTGWIRSLVFDPNRTGPYWLAGAGFDKTVHVWEIILPDAGAASTAAASARQIRSFRGATAPMCAVDFTADGKSIISAGLSDSVKFWELTPTACLTTWPDPEGAFDLLFTPDGSRIITAGAGTDHAIRIRDAASGEVLHALTGHGDVVSSLAMSPDGKRLASSSYDHTVRTWSIDEAAGTSGPTGLVIRNEKSINSISWAPAGDVFATADEGGVIRFYRAADGEAMETIPVKCDRIPSLRFSGDGRFLAAAIMPQNTVLLIDRRTGEQRTLPGHEQSIRSVRFSPDSTVLASAGDDLMIRLWSLREGSIGQCVATLAGHQQDMFAMTFSKDGTMLASGGRGGLIKLWSVATGRCLGTLPSPHDMVFGLAFSPDGKRLLSAGRGGMLGVWDLTYYDRHIAGNLAAFAQP